VAEEIERPEGSIPHHLPGTNPFPSEFAKKYGLPVEATRGGAETTYPEYRLAMRAATANTSEPAAHPAEHTEAEPSLHYGIHVQRVRGNISMLSGAGGNITVDAGNEGVLLVDTGLADKTEQVLAEIGKISDKPIRYIIDTQLDLDHTGGNETIAKLG